MATDGAVELTAELFVGLSAPADADAAEDAWSDVLIAEVLVGATVLLPFLLELACELKPM